MIKLGLLISLLLVAQGLGADSPIQEPADLIALKAAYRNQIEQAVKPINARYKERLTELLKKETQKGNLDGALAVRDELAKVNEATAAPAADSSASEKILTPTKESPYYATKWQNKSGSSTVEFFANGIYRHSYQGNVISGRWKTTNQSSVIKLMDWPNRPETQIRLIRDGTACARNFDSYEYEKTEPSATAEGKADKPSSSGKPSPFGAN